MPGGGPVSVRLRGLPTALGTDWDERGEALPVDHHGRRATPAH